jgi:hypothetical protein
MRVHEALWTTPSRWALMIRSGGLAICPTICSPHTIAPYRSEQVASASTRQSRYFHCKEQARNNGRSFSATGSLHRHPRMQERCPIA